MLSIRVLGVLTGVSVAAALSMSAASAAPATAPGNPALHQRVPGAKPGGGGGGGSNLIDHGGPVLPASKTYAIWWGTASAFPSDAQTGLDALFNGLNGTSFLGIAQQYMRTAAVSASFGGNLFDSSSPPSSSPSTSAILNEVVKVVGQGNLNPNAIYFVYTSNFPSQNSFCAWHSGGTSNGVNVQFAYMPNTSGISGCDPDGIANYYANSYSEGTRSLGNVTSHEFMEAITDAQISAWYDRRGSEIGDKCAWKFTGAVQLASGTWGLQEEWSNSAGGCVQQ
jgi:hypothetical protein